MITNNLSVAMALSEEVSNRIIVPGGEIRLPDRDFVGEEVVDFFARYRAEVAIFDHGGRMIRVLGGREMPAGHHRLAWDGRGQDGHRVASGVYLLLVRAGSDEVRRRVMVLR